MQRLLLTSILTAALLTACAQTTPPAPTQSPQEKVVVQFISSLNSLNVGEALKLVVPSEVEYLGKLAGAAGLSQAELENILIQQYTRGCTVSKIQIERVEPGANQSTVFYRLELKDCLSVQGSIIVQASPPLIAKLSLPPALIAGLNAAARSYSQNVYKAAIAFLAEDPTRQPSDAATPDCTKGYSRGNYLVSDPRGLLSSCKVEASSSDVRVTVQTLTGETYTVPK